MREKISLGVVISILLFISFSAIGQVKDSIEYQEINIPCLDAAEQDKEIVIDNKADYDKLVDKRIKWGACKDQQVPNVDFENKTLIGYLVETKGCTAPGVRVELLNKIDHYTFQVFLKQNGTCDSAWSKLILVLVDKIKEIKVDFETRLEDSH